MTGGGWIDDGMGCLEDEDGEGKRPPRSQKRKMMLAKHCIEAGQGFGMVRF